MTTYPLATLSAQITSTGISAPSYNDIYQSLIAIFQNIYGSDIYVAADSQDGQLIAILATAINNANQTTIAAYNSFSPTYAQGAGLSSVVQINGIQRATASNSTAVVTIAGNVGTVLNNCLVGDNLNLGTQWSIPSGTTIGSSGSVTVTATCTTAGAISLAANALTVILTPVYGWISVTNGSAATPGNPVETDAALRARQQVSTGLPAQTVLGGIDAALANVSGVSRVAIYENDTGAVNTIGLPAHSISAVVAGGSATAIAQAIEKKKAPGVATYGNTTVQVYDHIGVPISISYYPLSDVTITITVALRALTNFVSSTETLIQYALSGFINSYAIGQLVYLSDMYAPANLSGDIALAAINAASPTQYTQSQLDAISNTYMVAGISISRATNIADTTATAIALAGNTTVYVASNADFYVTCPVSILLANGSYLNTTVTSTGTSGAIVVASAIPAGTQVNIGANIFLTQDVKVAFYEAATATTSNITVTAS